MNEFIPKTLPFQKKIKIIMMYDTFYYGSVRPEPVEGWVVHGSTSSPRTGEIY